MCHTASERGVTVQIARWASGYKLGRGRQISVIFKCNLVYTASLLSVRLYVRACLKANKQTNADCITFNFQGNGNFTILPSSQNCRQRRSGNSMLIVTILNQKKYFKQNIYQTLSSLMTSSYKDHYCYNLGDCGTSSQSSKELVNCICHSAMGPK